MANNLFMSDYQKIIFANNINENNISGNGFYNIESLSAAYPFVVFVTDYNGINSHNNDIKNIWVDGIRATRFVGVDPDPNKSTITIGDRTIKLSFDYNTGLLSFVDANKLESIQLVAFEYIKPNISGGESTGYKDYNGIEETINAIDNKFRLVFRFRLYEGGDLSIISKSLIIGSIVNSSIKYFTVSGGYSVDIPGYPNSSTDACYAYDCQIQYDTERSGDDNDKSYIATSQYDNNVRNQFKFKLRLNPVNYDIILDETGETINNGSIKNLEANRIYKINVWITPRGNGNSELTYPKSDNYKSIILNVTSDNTDCIEINDINNNGYIYNSTEPWFSIKTKNTTSTYPIKINLSLDVQNLIGDRNEHYQINKSFSVNLSGGNVYFYCGYDWPEDTEEFRNKMRDITSNVNNKDLNPLYDWKSNDWGIYDDSNKDFFIAFTSGYEDIIRPCWDCYTGSGTYKKYVALEVGSIDSYYGDNETYRFNKIENDTPEGITVYKSQMHGKFFGKIQIQNN